MRSNVLCLVQEVNVVYLGHDRVRSSVRVFAAIRWRRLGNNGRYSVRRSAVDGGNDYG